MVVATDRDPVVTVTSIEGTKTFRLTCDSDDWMETAGSKSVATRKKNSHIADHRSALHGAPGVPTIMDAIEGDVEMPEGSFREPVPVGDVEYLRGLREEVEIREVSLVAEEPNPAVGVHPVRTKDLAGEPIVTSTGWSVVPHSDDPDDVAAAEFMAEMIEEGGEQFTQDVMADVAQAMLGEAHGTGWSSPKSAEERERRLEMFPPHTRTMTDAGPDFCKECSDAIQDWVVWPCPAVADKMPDVVEPEGPAELAVALTRSRLEAQRGPSDADKDSPDSAWHAARANSVSATLAAKLGSASDVDYLIAREVRERLNAQRFWGNAYTRWGREREPHIERAAYARYGIEPESCLFFGRANPRHTASPDGIAVHPITGQVRLGEYKTSGKELTWAKVVSNGYYDQVQWQLYVLEADHAFLMWEWRHGEKDQYDTYVPEPGGEHLITRDEERIAELVRRANLFLDALDSARAETVTSEPVDPQLLHLVTEHLEAKAAAKQAEEDLREFCEASGVKSVEIDGVAKVSYSYGSPRTTFNTKTFREHHPELYDAYLEVGAPPERPTLRVTAKGDDEG